MSGSALAVLAGVPDAIASSGVWTTDVLPCHGIRVLATSELSDAQLLSGGYEQLAAAIPLQRRTVTLSMAD